MNVQIFNGLTALAYFTIPYIAWQVGVKAQAKLFYILPFALIMACGVGYSLEAMGLSYQTLHWNRVTALVSMATVIAFKLYEQPIAQILRRTQLMLKLWQSPMVGVQVMEWHEHQGDFKIVDFNPAALDISAHHLRSGTWLCDVLPNHRDYHADLGCSLLSKYEQAVKSGQPDWFKLQDSTAMLGTFLNVSVIPLDENLLGLAYQDISQQERDRLHVEQSQISAAQLGSVLSHAVRGTLVQIASAAELARETPEMSAELLRIIQYQAQDAEQLGNAINRLYRNNVKLLQLEKLDLAPLITTVMEIYCFNYHWELAGDETVWADRILLTEVLTVYIQNAIRYQRPDTALVLKGSIETRDGMASVTLTDNGRGFNPQYADRLFQPNGRLHGDVEGNGIGLSMVARVIERHGGYYWGQSAGEGCGATFGFTVRLCR